MKFYKDRGGIVLLLLLMLCVQIESKQHGKVLQFITIENNEANAISHNRPMSKEMNQTDFIIGFNNATLRIQRQRLGMPCSCESLTCGCCANMTIETFGFRQLGCLNLTYDPDEFSMGINVLMNGVSFYQTSVSAKNPRPICIPLPQFPLISGCIRFHNIFTPGHNLHACVDLEALVYGVPVLVITFDCFRIGADGIAILKPEDGGGLGPDEAEEDYDEVDDYDEVEQEIEGSGSEVEDGVNPTPQLGSVTEVETGQNTTVVNVSARPLKVKKKKRPAGSPQKNPPSPLRNNVAIYPDPVPSSSEQDIAVMPVLNLMAESQNISLKKDDVSHVDQNYAGAKNGSSLRDKVIYSLN